MITSLIFIKMHKKIKNLMIIFIYNNRGSVCGSDLESKIHKCSSMKLNVKNIFDRNLQENKRDKIQLT